MCLLDVSGADLALCWTGTTPNPAPGYIAALVVEARPVASVSKMIGRPPAPLTMPEAPHHSRGHRAAHG
jgi:hypothetical protein